MDHIAIMKKSWGFTDKIMVGEKTIESRWYGIKCRPWGRIKKGDMVYFKDAGALVSAAAEVTRVEEIADLSPQKMQEILGRYGAAIGIRRAHIPSFFSTLKNKKYCILIHLKNPRRMRPFAINKTGFGAMSAWMTVSSIGRVRVPLKIASLTGQTK